MDNTFQTNLNASSKRNCMKFKSSQHNVKTHASMKNSFSMEMSIIVIEWSLLLQ